jgi:hypothetical protein
MKSYTTIKITPMGDYDQKFGQTYWGTVEEAQMPVRFNLMNPVNFDEGMPFGCEEAVIKESSKGTEYLQLRKVKVSGGTAPSHDGVKTPQQLDRIEAKLDQLLEKIDPPIES